MRKMMVMRMRNEEDIECCCCWCPRVPEVDHHPVADELGDRPLVLLDDVAADRLIAQQDVTHGLGVEHVPQGRRPDEVAEHHRQLA